MPNGSSLVDQISNGIGGIGQSITGSLSKRNGSVKNAALNGLNKLNPYDEDQPLPGKGFLNKLNPFDEDQPLPGKGFGNDISNAG